MGKYISVLLPSVA
ncbi:hypothetical protein YPPY102_4415, partial [Yersinia pestis PY-102]